MLYNTLILILNGKTSDQIGSFYGFVKWESSQEMNNNGVMQNFTKAKITTHYNSTITNQHRLKIGNKILNIGGIINVEESNFISEISATEVKT